MVMQAILDYCCAMYGHDIVWNALSTSEKIPPGRYICQRCGKVVAIKGEMPKKVKDE